MKKITSTSVLILAELLLLLAATQGVAEAKASDSNSQTVESCDLASEGTDCAAYPFEVCDKVDSICVHKEVFPAEPSEIVAVILLPILFGISSVGGIGGGIILLPILLSLFSFTTKEAVSVASVVVFESAFIRFAFFSAYAKHP